ncbi:hypothetical protein [Haladaptatus salinisoli]|uniref:hypothetical protein n=1 Tax=Haladaptatus salinisoli TaxID=2884876 RepID=UPI001D09C298|nr:hypothetical protein [Haladaptatus salinisoli]
MVPLRVLSRDRFSAHRDEEVRSPVALRVDVREPRIGGHLQVEVAVTAVLPADSLPNFTFAMRPDPPLTSVFCGVLGSIHISVVVDELVSSRKSLRRFRGEQLEFTARPRPLTGGG